MTDLYKYAGLPLYSPTTHLLRFFSVPVAYKGRITKKSTKGRWSLKCFMTPSVPFAERRIINMENWIEVHKDVIPPGKYTTVVKCGEEDGVMISLESREYSIKIEFGALSALRILDEGMVLQDLYCKSEFEKYDADKFANTIYKVEGGDFEKFIKKITGETVYDYIEYKHYIIITLNYYIEVVSRWEPGIEVVSLTEEAFQREPVDK